MNQNMSAPVHTPVLVNEVVEALAVQPGGRYVDGTLGGGGHAAAILEQSSPGGQLLGIDADPEAIRVASTRLQAYKSSTLLLNENLVNLQAVCLKYDFQPVHGILFDLGLSSLQLSEGRRGFSFQRDGPLDMRLSPSQEVTAADIINQSSEAELAHIIRTYGEEAHSYKIARYLVKERPIKTTFQLVQAVEDAIGGRKGRIHPATKTFQALRIAVNHELENLESALMQAVKLLGFDGRLVVISYHSLEDRVVKQFMQKESRDCICPPGTPTCICGHSACLRLVNKKVVTPSLQEVELNRRSRSAKLRVAERTVFGDEYCEAAEKLCGLVGDRANGWRRPVLLNKLRMAVLAS